MKNMCKRAKGKKNIKGQEGQGGENVERLIMKTGRQEKETTSDKSDSTSP